MTPKRHGSRKITSGSRKSVNSTRSSQRKYGSNKSLVPRITAKKLSGDGSYNYGFSKHKRTKSGAVRPAKRIRKAGTHKGFGTQKVGGIR